MAAQFYKFTKKKITELEKNLTQTPTENYNYKAIKID